MAEPKLSQLFLDKLDDMASRQDVAAIIKKLIDFVREAKTKLEEQLTSHTKETDAKLAEISSKVSETEQRTTQRQDQDKETMYSESRTLMRYIKQEVQRLEAEMPLEYDDTEVRSLIDATKKAIPELPPQYDPTSVINDLKTLAERIDNLSKNLEDVKARPVAGGVSNLRIQQAFKYILKTEAPVGDINGVNTSYTVTQPIFAVLSFSLNGETIAQLPNYTISGRTITFSTALPAAYSGKDFEIKYI